MLDVPHLIIFDQARRAAAIARTTGNIEQQILAVALLGELLQETGDEEAGYDSFTQAMQLAERNGLRFLSARLLNDRAGYFFDKGDFLQFDHFSSLAFGLSRWANMPWTFTRCSLRRAAVFIRMNTPDQALRLLSSCQEQLRQFPNAALSAEVSQMIEQAKHTPSRPELKRN